MILLKPTGFLLPTACDRDPPHGVTAHLYLSLLNVFFQPRPTPLFASPAAGLLRALQVRVKQDD